jgi:hypothetical protein
MIGSVGGVKVLMSGSVILEKREDLIVEDGNGTTLKLSWDRADGHASGGGSKTTLIGDYPMDLKLDRGGFGIGEDGVMKQVRWFAQPAGADSRIITYTVLESPYEG